MTNEAKHTPVGNLINVMGSGGYALLEVVYAHNQDGDTLTKEIGFLDGCHTTPEQSQEWGNKIVRAVNCHDELVRAADKLLGAIFSVHGEEGFCDEERDALRTTLAKATGKERA